MRVLVALDKFKEALSAPAACAAAASGLRERHPDWELDLCPLADGGDGFVAALVGEKSSALRVASVAGPLGDKAEATWALVPEDKIPAAARDRLRPPRGSLAVIEMATCSGLALVAPGRRDVLRATSRGVGELLRAAALAGAGGVLLGVGGSATNDLGLGALSALGWTALDADGRPVDPVPAAWPRIARLAPPPADAPRTPPIWIACDVANPLCGPDGATFTYGPQKGLAAADAPRLDAEMRRLADLLAKAAGVDAAIRDTPGAGAAGGIAGGLMAAAGARLVGGFELVADWLDIEARVRRADLVVTGEGAFDATSLRGKGPGAIARLALAMKKTAMVFAGRIEAVSPPAGLSLLRITPDGMPRAEALAATARLLAEAARRTL